MTTNTSTDNADNHAYMELPASKKPASNKPTAKSRLQQHSKLLLIDTASALGFNVQITDSDSKYIKVLVSVNGDAKKYYYMRLGVVANGHFNTKSFANFVKSMHHYNNENNNGGNNNV